MIAAMLWLEQPQTNSVQADIVEGDANSIDFVYEVAAIRREPDGWRIWEAKLQFCKTGIAFMSYHWRGSQALPC